jgi:hypothetical protein
MMQGADTLTALEHSGTNKTLIALFVLTAKHNNADAAYWVGTCCENGWGFRRELAKALQFYRGIDNALLMDCEYLAELPAQAPVLG